MKLKVRELSWFKRREPTKEIRPVSVEVDNLQLVENHRCEMIVLYDNGIKYTLSGRVSQNDITGKWTVHGINPYGLSTLVDIEE